jgi:hypothetical protein
MCSRRPPISAKDGNLNWVHNDVFFLAKGLYRDRT